MIREKCFSIKFIDIEQLFYFFALNDKEAIEIQHDINTQFQTPKTINEVNNCKSDFEYVLWATDFVHPFYFNQRDLLYPNEKLPLKVRGGRGTIYKNE